MGIPKKEEREEKEESVWRNNDQKFPNVIKEIYASQKLIRLQEGSIQRGLTKIYCNEIVKSRGECWKQQERSDLSWIGTLGLTADWSLEVIKARVEWDGISAVVKEKQSAHQEFDIPQNYPSKTNEKSRFPQKNKSLGSLLLVLLYRKC